MNVIFVSKNNKDDQISNIITDIQSTELIDLDIETTALDPYFLTILLIQIGLNDNVYVLDARALNKEYLRLILNYIKGSEKTVIGHNIKFDCKAIKIAYGIEFRNLHDTFIIEKVINNGVGDLYPSLADLTLKYCNVKLDKEERASFINYEGPITQEQINYSAKDIIYLNKIYRNQVFAIEQAGMQKVYKLEMELEPVVIDMELIGIDIDVDQWDALATKASLDSGEISTELVDYAINEILNVLPEDVSILAVLEALKIKIHTKKETKTLVDVRARDAIRVLKEKLNLASPKQLKVVLEFLGMDVSDTNKKTLKKLNNTPFLEKLFELKEKRKRGNSFGTDWLEQIHPITHKIHQELNQVGTVTGRFSSKEPNLHQIPRTIDYRRCFIAGKGYKFIVSDYAQQELRILASVSGEPRMINAFINKEDPHSTTASLIFGKDLKDVTKDERQTGKTLNFATVYGTSAYGLNYNFGFEIKYAEELLDKFWKGYPVLSNFMEECKNRILELNRSRTPLGRRRYFKYKIPKEAEGDRYKLWLAKDKWTKSVKRQGFNQIVQGCGADITKQAMIYIYYRNPFGDKLKIILCTHDEILTRVDESIADEAKKFQEACMLEAEQVYLGDIPAEVESKISDFWEK